DAAPARGPRPWAVALPVAAGLAALALWQAGSLKLGGIFLGAAVAAVVTLLVLARGLVGAARRLPRAPWPAWRHGLGGLRRPGGRRAPSPRVAGGGARTPGRRASRWRKPWPGSSAWTSAGG